MPGYRPLQRADSAEHIALAEHCDELSRNGRADEAAAILEELIASMEYSGEPVPAWPYGRLAFLYRKLRRHADEVHLLERYISREPQEAEAIRYQARLSKARALLSRRGRPTVMRLRSDCESTVRGWTPNLD